MERGDTKTKREGDRTFYLLIYSLNSINSHDWAKLKSEAWNSIWVAESQVLKPKPAASQEAH